MPSTPKPRDPASHLRSKGALRVRVIRNKRKDGPRRAKHKGRQD